uniref:Ankyrin repeat domaincontaining protein 5like [Hydra vulgaris] n=1 Tax=Lepeophtheirus salmonis TaxID=72036 RepID=A0A0K2SZY1_LEPSM
MMIFFFIVDATVNKQNSLCIPTEYPDNELASVRHIFRTKNSVPSTIEAFPPIFVERKEWLNADVYIALLDKKVLPRAREKFRDNFVFTPNAPCPCAAKIQTFLRDNFPDFWGLNMRLPSSPDVNPTLSKHI